MQTRADHNQAITMLSNKNWWLFLDVKVKHYIFPSCAARVLTSYKPFNLKNKENLPNSIYFEQMRWTGDKTQLHWQTERFSFMPSGWILQRCFIRRRVNYGPDSLDLTPWCPGIATPVWPWSQLVLCVWYPHTVSLALAFCLYPLSLYECFGNIPLVASGKALLPAQTLKIADGFVDSSLCLCLCLCSVQCILGRDISELMTHFLLLFSF